MACTAGKKRLCRRCDGTASIPTVQLLVDADARIATLRDCVKSSSLLPFRCGSFRISDCVAPWTTTRNCSTHFILARPMPSLSNRRSPMLAARFGCGSSALALFDHQMPHANLFLTTGALDAESSRLYAEYYGALDPAPLAVLNLAPGTVSATNRLLGEQHQRGEFFRDYYQFGTVSKRRCARTCFPKTAGLRSCAPSRQGTRRIQRRRHRGPSALDSARHARACSCAVRLRRRSITPTDLPVRLIASTPVSSRLTARTRRCSSTPRCEPLPIAAMDCPSTGMAATRRQVRRAGPAGRADLDATRRRSLVEW